MYRPEHNYVLAADNLPGIRPGNQTRLTPDLATNRCASCPGDILPGMGGVRQGNDQGSLGLQSPARDAALRLAAAKARTLSDQRASERMRHLNMAGSPDGPAGATQVTLTFEQAAGALPGMSGSALPGMGGAVASAPRLTLVRQLAAGPITWLVYSKTDGRTTVWVAIDSKNASRRTPEMADEYSVLEYLRAAGFNAMQRRGSAASVGTMAAASTAQGRSQRLVPFVWSPGSPRPDAYAPPGYSNLTPAEAAQARLGGISSAAPLLIPLVAVAIGALVLHNVYKA